MKDSEIDARIADIEREINRIKNLPPPIFPTRRRAGSGNPTREGKIARLERQLEILKERNLTNDVER